MRYQLAVLIAISVFVQVQLTTKTDGNKNDDERNDGDDVLVEPMMISEGRKYVRKCCPINQGFVGFSCQELLEPFDFNGWSGNGGFNASQDVDIEINIDCSIRNHSNPLFAYPSYHEGEYYLTRDGDLHILMYPDAPTVYIPDHYCLDNYVTKDNTTVINAVFCHVQEPEKIKYTLNAYCMLISCFFILLTVIVYVCLPKMLNLPNMILITYLLSFFVSFVCLATVIFLNKKGPSRTLCNTLTFIIYFSMLAAFSWINVMCYDTWNKFGGESMYLRQSRSRYYRYCLYGFGVPTLLTAWLAICEFTNIPVPIKPELDVQKCFFDGTVKQVYLYTPILILCVTNITLFILTAVKIALDERQTERVYSQDGQIHNQRKKKKFVLYVKLFTIMGISWVLEVMSSFYPAAGILWNFSDAYNLLVGFVIFIMFVCKRKIYDKIQNRFKMTRKLMGSTQTTMITVTTSQQNQSTHLSSTSDKTRNNGQTELPILNGDRKTKY